MLSPSSQKGYRMLVFSVKRNGIHYFWSANTYAFAGCKNVFEINEDREKLYLSLSKAIDFYKLVSFDNEDNSASHYYMRDYMGEENPTIENKVCKNAKTKYKK